MLSKKRQRDLDQFYTKSSVAKDCVDFLRSTVGEFNIARFIEPSAGKGAFLQHLPESTLALDIYPLNDKIIKQDFLTWKKPKHFKGFIVAIGNPPFGQNASIALQFINKCADFSDVIAFILPKTFKKAFYQDRVNLNFWLEAELELDPNSFEFDSKEKSVPCVFQVWRRKEEPRIKQLLVTKHKDFEFTTRDNADFAIRRVGRLAGKLIFDYSNYATASHYFIKSKVEKEQLVNHLKNIDWSVIKENTAGVPSVGKAEIIAEYCKVITSHLD